MAVDVADGADSFTLTTGASDDGGASLSEASGRSAASWAFTGRGRQFLLMVAAAVAAAYARFAIGPVQETMRVALSLSDNQMALLQGPALALPMVLAAVPIGFLIDRYSRARLLVFFSVLNVSGALLTAAAVNFGLLFLARCVAGLAVAAVSTTAFALIGDLYAPAQRGRATMMVVIGQYAGMSAAFAVGGVLVAHFASAPQGWHRAMFALAAPLVPVTLLLLATREPPRAGSATGGSRREPFARSFGHAALPSSQP